MPPGLARAAGGRPPRGPNGPLPLARQAQATIDPVIAAITAAANRRAQAAEAAIHGYTQSYANQLGGLNIGAPYVGAEAGQAAIDSALQQSLSGAGSDLASQLAARLSALQGSSGAGAVNTAAGNLASQGTASGNTALTHGSAALSNLLAQAAGAQTFGQKLPGIADLSGLQGLKQAEGQAQQTISQGTIAAESKLPDIMQQLRSDQLARQSLQVSKAYKAAQIQMGYQRLAIEQQNANTAAARAAASNNAAWARIGIARGRLRLDIAKADFAARGGGLSPAETSRYQAEAQAWAQRTTGTYTNPTTGKVQPAMTFKDAMTSALKQGIPFSIAYPTFVQTYQPNPGELAQLEKYYSPLDKQLAHAYHQYVRWGRYGPPGPQGPSAANPSGAGSSGAGAGLIRTLQNAGFRGQALKQAWAIAMRESGGNPAAFNGNASTGDKSYGLFQINMIGSLGPARLREYGLTSEKQLLDPVVNARVAYQMSKGGRDFGAWGIGPNAYQGAPAEAYAAYLRYLQEYPG